jgi:hypothetical protein
VQRAERATDEAQSRAAETRRDETRKAHKKHEEDTGQWTKRHDEPARARDTTTNIDHRPANLISQLAACNDVVDQRTNVTPAEKGLLRSG